MDLSKYTSKNTVKKTISSKYMQEQRSIRISVPPGYNELISYPIIYAQDGQDVFMYGRIATIVNYLILEKGMEPVIVVGVDVSKQKRTSEYTIDGIYHEAYKDFFVREVVSLVEEEYLVRKQGVSRLLIGDSLGATIALRLALEHEDLFRHILSLSGAFFEDSVKLLNQEKDLNWLTMWMLVGREETDVETYLGNYDFLTWNSEMRKALIGKKANVTYLEKTGVHTWGFWQKELPTGLMHFFR